MEKQVKLFLEFLQNEKKLSDNTLQSYKRDIIQYQNYLEENGINYAKVSKEDIKHYYEIAPIIVESINNEEKSIIIYDYIYDNIIDYCIEQIEQGNYDKAYSRYKNSILVLEEQFAKPMLEQRLVRVLKRTFI